MNKIHEKLLLKQSDVHLAIITYNIFNFKIRCIYCSKVKFRYLILTELLNPHDLFECFKLKLLEKLTKQYFIRNTLYFITMKM